MAGVLRRRTQTCMERPRRIRAEGAVCRPRTEVPGGPALPQQASTSSTRTGRRHTPAVEPVCGALLWRPEPAEATEILAGQAQPNTGSCVHTLGGVPEASVTLTSAHRGSRLPVQPPSPCRELGVDTHCAWSHTGPPPNQTLASGLQERPPRNVPPWLDACRAAWRAQWCGSHPW